MLAYLRRNIPDNHPLRLFYHKVLAVVAAIRYRFPGNCLHVIAVTGTNGKTTTLNLIAQILETAGYKVGISSSIYFQVGRKRWFNITKQTTLGPFFMQRLLRSMVKAGCQYALIEVTSHAMTQSRLWGLNVDTAVLTNITKDHIEYHGSFHKYVEAKGQLFDMLRSVKRKPGIQKISILNLDSNEFSYFNQYISDRKVTYGLNAKADYYAKNVECSPGFSKFIFAMPNHHAEIRIAMPGRFNVYNAVAAGTVASAACGVPIEMIQKTLEKAQSFPGRMESIHAGQSFPIVVDYAHTPESIEEVCRIFRQLTQRRLFVVFGATGGGRDKSKRPLMGNVVEKYADCIFVTNDDPYDEDEYGIIEQVCEGIKRQEGNGLWKIIDRKEAIRTALHMASSNDAVLILGKGCEQVICLKEGKVPYDDREVVRNIIENEIL